MKNSYLPETRKKSKNQSDSIILARQFYAKKAGFGQEGVLHLVHFLNICKTQTLSIIHHIKQRNQKAFTSHPSPFQQKSRFHAGFLAGISYFPAAGRFLDQEQGQIEEDYSQNLRCPICWVKKMNCERCV